MIASLSTEHARYLTGAIVALQAPQCDTGARAIDFLGDSDVE